jgi:hypothetical protein
LNVLPAANDRFAAAGLDPVTKECAMKLTATQVERTLTQFPAQAIPDDHPVVPQLSQLFGEHTFFLDGNGLSIVEPDETADPGGRSATVINLANWTDANLTSLAPHAPEPTDIVIVLEPEATH